MARRERHVARGRLAAGLSKSANLLSVPRMFAGSGGFGFVRVDAPGIFENIDKDRLGTQVDDGRGGSDPVGVGHDDLVAGADAERGHAHVQRAGTTGGGDGILHAEMLPEGGFKAVDVVVAMVAPAIGSGVGGIGYFTLGDGGFGIEDAGFLHSLFQ